MKIFFSYFVEFDKDKSILSKNYFKDCIVSEPNKRPIIMIIQNKNIFLIIDGQQKI